MNQLSLTRLLFAAMIVSFCACDSDNQSDVQPQLALKSIGFSGTMPDGRTFSEKDLVPHNALGSASSTADGSYIYHSLSLSDSAAGLSIVVELPHVQYSNEYIEANDAIIREAAIKYYPYTVVKEKLSVGDKFIVSSPTTDPTSSFRVLVTDQKNYTGFISEGAPDQDGSYLKVTELIESTETNATLGSVNVLEVVFDLAVKLFPTDQAAGQPETLKGLLRMKYQQQ